VSQNCADEIDVGNLEAPSRLLADRDWDREFFRTMIAGRWQLARRLIRRVKRLADRTGGDQIELSA
jgi:hypothetical protein